jgi:hypothetical protein
MSSYGIWKCNKKSSMVNMLLGLAKYSNLSGLHPTAPKTLMKSKKKNNQNQKIYEKLILY